MREIQAISAMRALFAVSPRQKNAVFTCDAELVELGASLYGLSMDEFSPEEDALPATPPEALGKNLAVAVIADVLAAGCVPEFYLHALVAPAHDAAFCEKLAQGVRSVLEEGGCFLLGGDFGQAQTWRYTGFCLGKAAPSGPLTRILPQKKQTLWVTGSIGDGNRHALAGTMPAFEPRFAEAAKIRNAASACIDTSGGLADSLRMLAHCNPEHVFAVDGNAVPYEAESAAMLKAGDMPQAALALGGAGEYELLFAAPPEAECPFATRIGTAFPASGARNGEKPGVCWSGRMLPENPPDPRSLGRDEYIRRILEAAAQCT